MLDIIAQAYDAQEPVQRVFAVVETYEPYSLLEVSIQFYEKALRIYVDDDTDELRVTYDIPANLDHSDSVLIDCTETVPWRNLCGKRLLWGWRMQNQQGYQDGLQLQFAAEGLEAMETIQFMGAASSIHVSCPTDVSCSELIAKARLSSQA